MLQSLKNIDSSYRQTRMLFFGVIFLVSLLGIYSMYSAHQARKEAAETIYIFDEGSIVAARSKNIMENRPVEARSHIVRFHELYFTLSPDQKAIKNHIDRALVLADESAKAQYDNLKEKGYYNEMIAGNVSQNIRIDEVQLDESIYPYKVRCIAKQEIIRTSSITIRNLITECTLRDVARSDDNPHGFLIENWTTLDNSDIKTVSR